MKRKIQINEVNISSTFLPRCRCKHCGGGPEFYYATGNRPTFKDAHIQIQLSGYYRKYIKRMCRDFYLWEEPSSFRDTHDFKFRLDKQYSPILHRTVGAAQSIPFESYMKRQNVTDVLCCICGDTTWVYNVKSSKGKPEIINRKGRYNYPSKFEY